MLRRRTISLPFRCAKDDTFILVKNARPGVSMSTQWEPREPIKSLCDYESSLYTAPSVLHSERQVSRAVRAIVNIFPGDSGLLYPIIRMIRDL